MMESNDVKLEAGARLLETLTSALYSDPIVVFREYVQNSVDSFVLVQDTNRELEVSITVDLQNRHIKIDDNGSGIPREKFQSIMLSLGKSEKTGDVGQIGFRGIGRLAGLAFCEKLEFFNKKTGQKFSLDGKRYREILNSYEGRSQSLDNVMREISHSEEGEAEVDCEGFRVEMYTVSEELLNVIMGCSYNLRSKGAISKGEVSSIFVDALRMMLPLPYPMNFDKRDVIEREYKRLFSRELAESEFKVSLNGQQLFKNVTSIGDQAFVMIPLKIRPNKDDSLVVIGLLWLSFGFVLRSVGRNFGVAVRSRNMLVQGGTAFASEAAQGNCAITTYGQYLAATKAITGELLLNTKFLSDNSRRDWFKLDANAFQLREQICDVMNGVHLYRYAISRYVNSDDKNEGLKQKVFDAYRRIKTSGQGNNDLTQVEKFLADIEGKSKERIVDEKSDVLDIMGYSRTQKEFYKKIMDYLYEFCNQGGGQLGLTHYYALKSYVVKRLNESCDD